MKETVNKESVKTYRVALYLRVSTDEQVEKFGLEMQRESLKALIKSKGVTTEGKPLWELAGDRHIYIDEGISGTIPINDRPGFARLKEDIIHASEDNKPFDIVAVYKIDRFARKLKVLLDVIDFFEDNEIQFVSANESIDTSTPFGKAMLNIIGIIAELERDTIIKRTSEGRAQAAISGVALGNSATYGYVKDENKRPVICEEERDVIREIFNLFINGNSIEKIAIRLRENGVLTPEASAVKHGKRKGGTKHKNPMYYWRAERIRLILQDEIYIGKQYYNKSKDGKPLEREDWKVSEYEIPPIMDLVMFEKVQRLLERGKHERKKNGGNTKQLYLLSGLLRCDCCYDPQKDNIGRSSWHATGKKLDNGRSSHYYVCGRKSRSKTAFLCPAISLPGKATEDYITNFCFELIKSPVAVFKHQQELKSTKEHIKILQRKLDDTGKLITSSESRKARMKEQHTEGLMDMKKLKINLKEEDERLIRLKNEYKKLEAQMAEDGVSEQYMQTLEYFSEEYKQKLESVRKDKEALYDLLHYLIEEIVVFTRPVHENDKVAGIKKQHQQIPNELHIKLKLPQEILNQLAEPTLGSMQKITSGAR